MKKEFGFQMTGFCPRRSTHFCTTSQLNNDNTAELAKKWFSCAHQRLLTERHVFTMCCRIHWYAWSHLFLSQHVTPYIFIGFNLIRFRAKSRTSLFQGYTTFLGLFKKIFFLSLLCWSRFHTLHHTWPLLPRYWCGYFVWSLKSMFFFFSPGIFYSLCYSPLIA